MSRTNPSRVARPALLCAAAALLLAGCPGPASHTPPQSDRAAKPSQPLTVLIVDDAELGQAVAREWRSRTEEDLKIEPVTAAQLAAAHRLPGDAIIFPSGLLGYLAERELILPIEPAALEEPAFDHRDIFELLRRQEMRWGNRTFAAPLGSPQLLLAYRADIFAKLGLSPPADWKSYQELVVRLADRSLAGESASADQPWQSTIEPLADGWAGQMLLARAAPYALHRDQVSPLFQYDSLTPLIDQAPYVRALEELKAAAAAGSFADRRMTPAEAMTALRAGSCAMAICWPAANNRDSKIDGLVGSREIRFAPLPGSRQAYRFATKTWEPRAADESPHVPLLSVAGRLAAVTSSTAVPSRAQSLVLWLAGREVSSLVAPHAASTTLFRHSQVASAARWTGNLPADAAQHYGNVVAQTLTLPRAFPALRLPGREQYLAALDTAVHDAIRGGDSQAALAKARERWQEITKQLGAASQKKANARSLGEEGH